MGKRRSNDEGKALVERFQASGLSRTQFAAQEGVSPQTLKRWIQKLNGGETQSAETRFVEVLESKGSGMTIRVGDVEIRFNGLPSPEYLAEVVQGLSGAC
jgi:transposase-like protein